MSKLKKLVNDKPLWDNMVHTNMEQAEDQKALFRFQGQASALRKLKTLREEVNADG